MWYLGQAMFQKCNVKVNIYNLESIVQLHHQMCQKETDFSAGRKS